MSIFIVFKIYKALITLKMPETVIVSGIFVLLAVIKSQSPHLKCLYQYQNGDR